MPTSPHQPGLLNRAQRRALALHRRLLRDLLRRLGSPPLEPLHGRHPGPDPRRRRLRHHHGRGPAERGLPTGLGPVAGPGPPRRREQRVRVRVHARALVLQLLAADGPDDAVDDELCVACGGVGGAVQCRLLFHLGEEVLYGACCRCGQ